MEKRKGRVAPADRVKRRMKTAAVVAGLAVVATGAFAYSSAQAEVRAASSVSLDTLQTVLNRMESRINALDQRLNPIDQKVSKILGVDSSMEARLNGIFMGQQSMDSKLNRILSLEQSADNKLNRILTWE
ncbi:MAG TPA: hypothetical protein VN397_02085, partial [Candidatus Methylomirabilis sp.]|nr:hypothetical protein [Candidatus Methylomirabilis sp.]